MLPYTVEEITRRITPIAQKYRLTAVYLFGSYARGDATPDSDVDLLVDTTGLDIHSLLQLAEILNDFEEALGTRVDLITVAGLEQPIRLPSDVYFRENVMRERRMIYAVA